MNQDTICFDLGTNFDYRLFDIIDQYDKKHSITNLYGKLRYDGLPGGRSAAIIPPMTMDELEKYVGECKKRDLEFNYLINPLSLDQNVIDPEVGKQMRDFIHNIYDMGIRAITLNSPAMIHYVRNTFPDMFITLGLYAYPSKIHQIEYWRNWGVNEITLDHCFNRRFDVMRQVLTNYKDCEDFHFRLIANNLCLRECPFRLAHGAFVGHSDPQSTSIDYCLINCNYLKAKQPSRILSSEWIRPEDIHYYRELAEETGNKNLCIKLVDRCKSTAFLERVVKAYMEESYDGNLLDIVNWPDTRNMGKEAKNNDKAITQAFAGAPAGAGAPPAGAPAGAGAPPAGGPAAAARRMGPPPGVAPLRFVDKMAHDIPPKFGRTMSFPQIYVDNKKLDGFLEHFIKDCRCDQTICRGGMTEGVADKFPNACGYCEGWAKKAISYNEQEVAEWTAVASSLLTSIEDGTMFRED